jgi:hypothetical protein
MSDMWWISVIQLVVPSISTYCQPSSGIAERKIDIATFDDSPRAAWRPLIAPVQIGVPDHGIRRRRTPSRHVICRVGVADQGRIIAAYERTMER